MKYRKNILRSASPVSFPLGFCLQWAPQDPSPCPACIRLAAGDAADWEVAIAVALQAARHITRPWGMPTRAGEAQPGRCRQPKPPGWASPACMGFSGEVDHKSNKEQSCCCGRRMREMAASPIVMPTFHISLQMSFPVHQLCLTLCCPSPPRWSHHTNTLLMKHHEILAASDIPLALFIFQYHYYYIRKLNICASHPSLAIYQRVCPAFFAKPPPPSTRTPPPCPAAGDSRTMGNHRPN